MPSGTILGSFCAVFSRTTCARTNCADFSARVGTACPAVGRPRCVICFEQSHISRIGIAIQIAHGSVIPNSVPSPLMTSCKIGDYCSCRQIPSTVRSDLGVESGYPSEGERVMVSLRPIAPGTRPRGPYLYIADPGSSFDIVPISDCSDDMLA